MSSRFEQKSKEGRAFFSRTAFALVFALALALAFGGCSAACAAKGPRPGQIVVDRQNPAWLVYHGGGPFFMAGPGDPEGFLYRGELRANGTRRGDQKKLIRKLAKTGANSIYLMAVRSHGGDGDSTQNPFVDNDPKKGLNRAVLRQWNRWFRLMDRKGIVIFFIFYDDSALVWNTGSKMGSEERSFVRALVDRFEHRRHLIWVVAEEYQESYQAERISRIAAEIRAADDRNHPIAVHKLSGIDFSEFADDPNLDQFAIQYNTDRVDQLHEGVLLAAEEARGRYNLNLAEAAGWGSGAVARKKSWAVAMAGAYVMAFQQDIASTPLSDLEDSGRLVRFMESTDFHRMTSRNDLARGDTAYVLARPGKSYIAYAAEGSGRLGVADVHAGTWRLRWHDVATGREVVRKGVELSAGEHTWERPGGFGGEVAVYLERLGPDG